MSEPTESQAGITSLARASQTKTRFLGQARTAIGSNRARMVWSWRPVSERALFLLTGNQLVFKTTVIK